MLDILKEVEAALPRLLSIDGWNSLDIDYHDPKVERVWRQWLNYRISLHVIYPCERSASLFHPHPWPSAMRVLHGEYEMDIGYGEGLEHPPVACRMIFSTMHIGTPSTFIYEMTDPNGWHFVRPIKNPCYTLMVTGKPWKRETEEVTKSLKPLTPERMQQILLWFQIQYPNR